MSLPTLQMMSDANRTQAGDAVPLDAGQQGFIVTSDGDFAGRSWKAGDVVICQPQRETFVTVLMPTGRGVPRFGRIGRDGMTGCHGEPCSSRRFRPCGQVVGGLRHQDGQWVQIPQTWTTSAQPVAGNRPTPNRQGATQRKAPQLHQRVASTYRRQTRPSLGSTKRSAASFQAVIQGAQSRPTRGNTHDAPKTGRPPQLTLFDTVG